MSQKSKTLKKFMRREKVQKDQVTRKIMDNMNQWSPNQVKNVDLIQQKKRKTLTLKN